MPVLAISKSLRFCWLNHASSFKLTEESLLSLVMRSSHLILALSLIIGSSTLAQAREAFTRFPTFIRQDPFPRSHAIVRLPARAAVFVEDCEGGWCTVQWHNIGGFISANALVFPRPVYVVPPPPPPPVFYYERPRYHRHFHEHW